MAEAFVELGAEAVNHVTDRYWEDGYDKVRQVRGKNSNGRKNESNVGSTRSRKENREHKYQLPSPERERDLDGSVRRDDSLERESITSARVLKAYENEPDDPRRKVDSQLERRRRDSTRMSYANGYAQSQGPPRPRSQPPRRYDDDDDSDYDEHEVRRYRTTGRGYDNRDGKDYDREVIETERYRGPPRPQDPRRLDSNQSRGTEGPYGDGAMAPYRRSQGEQGTEVSRRPKSRGRNDRYERDDRDDRDRSYSRSRSRSRSEKGDQDGWRGKLDEAFDTSMQGLGVGIAGAVVGGLAGREYGKKHKNRDILIGALVGGLGANAAENKWQQRKEKKGEREDGRSRSVR
ncbi:hypothetical protein LTR08_007008 [Meristemomyces frigidus]|nr:hypothetical protein LTR08_007008 [Meristemomyces frigidus]